MAAKKNPLRVALLRGINVGKAKRVPMAELRALCEELGWTDVRTLLNSGNVVYAGGRGTPDTDAKRLAKALESSFGFEVPVTVLSADEVLAAVAANPFPDADDPSRLFVTALTGDAPSRLMPVADQDHAPEAFALVGRFAYAWCPDGALGGPLWPAVDRAVGPDGTTRNLRTMERLVTGLQEG